MVSHSARWQDKISAFFSSIVCGTGASNSRVERIFCNGAVSYNLYQKYSYPITKIKAQKLPSTSPANAAWSLDRLAAAWRIIL